MDKVYIHLLSDSYSKFGIPKTEKPFKKGRFSVNEIIEVGDNVEISYELILDDKKETETRKYSISTNDIQEIIFIGTSYFIFAQSNYYFDFDKDNGPGSKHDKAKQSYAKAADYLWKIISANGDNNSSCFPYYFFIKASKRQDGTSKHSLSTRKILEGITKHDIRAQYYYDIIFEEKNIIRRNQLIKQGWEKFKNDLGLAFSYASYLFRKGEYAQIVELFADNYLSLDRRDLNSWYLDEGVKIISDSILKVSGPTDAIKYLTKAQKDLDKEHYYFLIGRMQYFEGEMAGAENSFTEAILADKSNGETTEASLYYLLKINMDADPTKTYDVLDSLSPVSDPSDLEIIGIGVNYGGLAEKTLKAMIDKIDNYEKAYQGKIYALYAGLIFETNNLGDLSIHDAQLKIAVEKGLKAIKRAVNLQPNNKEYLGIMSKYYSASGEYDRAVDLRLQYPELLSDFYTIDIGHCTDTFLENFVSLIIRYQEENYWNAKDYLNGYFEMDVKELFGQKKYKVIYDLHEWLRGQINLKEIKTELNKEMIDFSGTLFNIAYSASEMDDPNTAKYLYELSLEFDSNSSVLNNLAIVYEKLGDLSKARRLITEAKKFTAHDKIINDNYARITSTIKNVSSEKTATNKTTQPKKIEFDQRNGDIKLGYKSCHIAKVGDYQYFICHYFLGSEEIKKEWVTDQDIEDEYHSDDFKNMRWIKDAIYKINQKTRNNLGFELIIINKNHSRLSDETIKYL